MHPNSFFPIVSRVHPNRGKLRGAERADDGARQRFAIVVQCSGVFLRKSPLVFCNYVYEKALWFSVITYRSLMDIFSSEKSLLIKLKGG